jgi:hypothetical protein
MAYAEVIRELNEDSDVEMQFAKQAPFTVVDSMFYCTLL